VIGVRHWLGRHDAVPLAAFKLFLPFYFVVDRGLEPFIVKLLVVALNRGKELRESRWARWLPLAAFTASDRMTACAIEMVMGPAGSLMLMLR
jgi:hypothetical protein